MSVTIRLLIPDQDYEQLAPLLNTVEVDRPTSAQRLRDGDTRAAEGQIRQRLVALSVAGELVGYGDANYLPWKPAGHFLLWVVVHPAWRKQGIGGALFDECLHFAQTQQATLLYSQVREQEAEGLRFAQQHAFAIERHEYESVLEVNSFDERPFAGVIEGVAATGIRFVTYADLGDTPEARQKFYAIQRSTTLDVPGADGSFPTFEQFSRSFFEASWFRPEGQLLALDGETIAGFCSVPYFEATNSMYNLMTGVEPAYRGRNIALALKLLVIRYAKAFGAATLRTDNDSENGPMLAINRKLGYQPRPGRYRLIRAGE